MSRSPTRTVTAKTQQALAKRAEEAMDALIETASNKLRSMESVDTAFTSQMDDELAQLAVSSALQRKQKIAQDSLFKQMKSKLVSFMRSLKQALLQKRNDIPNFAYRKTLYVELRKLLNEILMLENYDLQKCHLERVYLWFFERLRYEESIQAPTPNLKSAFFKSSDSKANRTLQFAEKNGMELFEQGMRTSHPQILPAKDRLDTLKAHKIKSEVTDTSTHAPGQVPSEQREPQSFYTSKQSVNFTSGGNKIEGKSNYMHYVPTNDERQQRMEAVWLQGKQKELVDKRNTEEMMNTVKEWGDAKARMAEESALKYERATDGSKFQNRGNEGGQDYQKQWMRAAAAAAEGLDIDYKKVYLESSTSQGSDESDYEGDDEETESEIEEEDEEQEESDIFARQTEQLEVMKNFKTEPNVKVFDMTLDPVKLPPQKKDEKEDDMEPPQDDKLTLAKGKQKIAHLKKFQGHIIKVSGNKQEDLNNIFVSSRAAGDVITLSVHTRGEKQKRPVTRDGDESSPEKEEKEKKGKKKGKADDDDSDKGDKSLQLMNVKGLNLGLRQPNDDFRLAQISEVDYLKQKLAKDSVFCPITTLERAILMPNDMTPPVMVETKFPAPGGSLLSNPFSEKKKKKKKKKKKGKKKGKKGD